MCSEDREECTLRDMDASDRNPGPQECVLTMRNLTERESHSAGHDCGVRKLMSRNSHSASIPDMEWGGGAMTTWSRLRPVTVTIRRPNCCPFSSLGQHHVGTSHPLGRLWEGRQACGLGEGHWRPNAVKILSQWWVARFLGGRQWPHRSHLEILGAKGDAPGSGDWVSYTLFYVGGSTLICLYFRVPGQGKIKNSSSWLGSLDLGLFQTPVRPHAHPQSRIPLKASL